jgi:O-antigen ligase
MVAIFIYLTALFIAPQLWVEPLVGVRVDFLIYPMLLLSVLLTSKRNALTLTDQDKFFLMMILWISLSWGANGFTDRGQEVLVNYVKWFVMYKAVSSLIVSAGQFRSVTRMLVGFAVVLAIEGIAHRFSQDGLGWAGQTMGWIDPSAMAAGEPGRTRWINIFDGPGVFCVVYTIALPFVLQYLISPFSVPVRLLGAGMLGLLLVAIYLTGSRGGFLTALAVFGLFVAIRMKISTGKIVGASLLIAVVFSLAPSHLTTMNDQSRSASHRVEMWAEGIEMIQQNPVLGIGKGSFAAYTGKLVAHNSAIEIMGETGFFGLLFWMGLIYMALKYIVHFIRFEADAVDRSYVTVLALSIIGYIISSLFVTLEYETFYFLLAMAAAIGYRVPQPVVFTRRDFGALMAIAIGWVVGIKLFVMAYFA